MTQLLISKALEDYCEKHSSPESETLAQLNRETYIKAALPQMLSGHIQGQLLRMVSLMVRPKRVLEIGTYTGYSAICLAQGLAEEGHLHTIDVNEELEDMAFRYICASGLKDKVTQHIGLASAIIPTLDEQFDLVFIDADKINYGLYYDLIWDKIPVGGYILADNVLYDGEVILEEEEQSKNAKAIHAFNEKIHSDDRVEKLLLPVRDGIMIIRKTA